MLDKTFKSCSKEIERTVFNQSSDILAIYCGKGLMVGDYQKKLVRSVKRSLRKTLGCSTLTFDELATVLVDLDTEGLSYALTSADLIDQQQVQVAGNLTPKTRRYKQQFYLLNSFVKQQQQDYLLSKESEAANPRSHNKSRQEIQSFWHHLLFMETCQGVGSPQGER